MHKFLTGTFFGFNRSILEWGGVLVEVLPKRVLFAHLPVGTNARSLQPSTSKLMGQKIKTTKWTPLLYIQNETIFEVYLSILCLFFTVMVDLSAYADTCYTPV